MTYYRQLSTEKYYHESVLHEIKQLRRQKNRDAVRGFMQFLFALGVIALTAYAIKEMPIWLPAVESYMDQYAITETIQTWFG
jgi:hypothetical protein